VACHYGGFLRDHDLQPSRFDLVPLELAVVEFAPVGLHHPAMAKRIAPSGIKSEPRFCFSLEGLRQVGQPTVMVLVPVADDQAVAGSTFKPLKLFVSVRGVSAKSSRICFSSAPRKDSK
jgi:hypothetical protein